MSHVHQPCCLCDALYRIKPNGIKLSVDKCLLGDSLIRFFFSPWQRSDITNTRICSVPISVNKTILHCTHHQDYSKTNMVVLWPYRIHIIMGKAIQMDGGAHLCQLSSLVV